MNRFITIIASLLITYVVSAQGFPDAQKQPKFKEQKVNHRNYAKRAHRRHIKRGTVCMPDNNMATPWTPICVAKNGNASGDIA